MKNKDPKKKKRYGMILVVSSRIEPSNRESTCFPTSITTSFLIKLVTNLCKIIVSSNFLED